VKKDNGGVIEAAGWMAEIISENRNGRDDKLASWTNSGRQQTAAPLQT